MSTEYDISICLGSSCFSRNNKQIMEIVKAFIDKHSLSTHVFFHGDLCSGNCENGPVMRIENEIYEHVTPDSVRTILEDFFLND